MVKVGPCAQTAGAASTKRGAVSTISAGRRTQPKVREGQHAPDALGAHWPSGNGQIPRAGPRAYTKVLWWAQACGSGDQEQRKLPLAGDGGHNAATCRRAKPSVQQPRLASGRSGHVPHGQRYAAVRATAVLALHPALTSGRAHWWQLRTGGELRCLWAESGASVHFFWLYLSVIFSGHSFDGFYATVQIRIHMCHTDGPGSLCKP